MTVKKIKPVEVEGVRGYVDKNNVAWLNAEDVARGLGFVDYQEKVSATSGRKTYEVIRWARVNGYLREFGYDKEVGKDDFIPENMFYRLAMKASNETAQAFQAKIADEILPSIRRDGFYSVYKKEIDRLKMERANFESARIRMECERFNLERAREQLNTAVAEKQIEKAKLLRELALATEDNDLRNNLIQHAAESRL